MDEVIKDAIGRYGAKIVGLDDSFEFRCTECGKCCTNREDILLTPRDLFRAAKELNMTVMDFFSEYCEKYIGDNSRLPVIRLKPRGTIRRCPLLENRRCRIHKNPPCILQGGFFTDLNCARFYFLLTKPAKQFCELTPTQWCLWAWASDRNRRG